MASLSIYSSMKLLGLGHSNKRELFDLKATLMTSPVLKLPDFSLDFVVTADASNIAIGGVLSQTHNGVAYPVAFYSKKLSAAEQKWPVLGQELYQVKKYHS